MSLFRLNIIVIFPSLKQEGGIVEISFILGLLSARQPLNTWSPDQRWREAHLLAAHSLSVAGELKSRCESKTAPSAAPCCVLRYGRAGSRRKRLAIWYTVGPHSLWNAHVSSVLHPSLLRCSLNPFFNTGATAIHHWPILWSWAG